MRKGVFPYEYIDCVEKLDERCLPLRKYFITRWQTILYPRAITLTPRLEVILRTLGEYRPVLTWKPILLLDDNFRKFLQ